ncbi:MAG: SDR family oxidoreductase [Alphaproteobacteria bacterium]|nr:SDR family oxidoreductase [Alphaproteobacteria bacterium]MBV9420767.1 SDR family oxidoreductase [Alphaproteobacteria bacterium]MBV9542133.1 SDR family oxidoreductase [Alphaproteobacteria bacterium]
MAGRLEGKVAVITGAASGIGRGTVDLFVAEGAKVIAADIQDDKGARIEEAHKGRAKYVRCDVSKEEDIAAACAAAVKHFGKLTTIFNNAGTGGASDTAENVTAENFDSVMHLHVLAALFGMKYAVPEMKKAGGGSIISTASVAGLQAGYGPILYSIAKAGIIHMSKLAATQLAPYNIRVNAICPGLIATNIFANAFGMPSQLADTRLDAIAEAAKHSQPMQRGGRPRDIAETALFLASDGSDWMTGQALVMDGGLTLGPGGQQMFGVFAPIVQALGVDQETLAQMVAGQPAQS